MYEVRLARAAQKSFDGADGPLRSKLDRCFEQLADRPRRHPNARPLRGQLGKYYRYRVGD
jgi:mRNA interferase RelE/StbE